MVRSVLFLALLFVPVAWATQAEHKTVLDGVYTAEQAAKGEELYEAECVKCHEGNDPDGPTLVGRTFIDRWREENLDVLFDFISTRMPGDAAGKLSEEEDLQVLAFLLKSNGYASGNMRLTSAVLPLIRMVGKEGPKPLPSNTLVEVFGCMTQSSDEDWLLTRASEPVRFREKARKVPDRALGSATFAMQSFTNVALDFKPVLYKDQKVRVRGVLIRQTNKERINPVVLETVAPTCTQ